MANKGTWSISIGGTVFADMTATVEPAGVSGGPLIMKIEGYGAAGVMYLNLGNLEIPWVFDITKEFSTDTLAKAFYMTGVQTWSGVNTVEVSNIDYSGTTTTWTITEANVRLEIQKPIGVTVISKLTITGGSAT